MSGLVEVLVKLVQELVSLYSPEWRCVWTGRGTGQTGPGTGSVLPSATRPVGQLLMSFLKPSGSFQYYTLVMKSLEY